MMGELERRWSAFHALDVVTLDEMVGDEGTAAIEPVRDLIRQAHRDACVMCIGIAAARDGTSCPALAELETAVCL